VPAAARKERRILSVVITEWQTDAVFAATHRLWPSLQQGVAG
jgi:hypothetical protein